MVAIIIADHMIEGPLVGIEVIITEVIPLIITGVVPLIITGVVPLIITGVVPLIIIVAECIMINQLRTRTGMTSHDHCIQYTKLHNYYYY